MKLRGAPNTPVQENYLTKEGAEKLAATIKNYWTSRGYDVEVNVVAKSWCYNASHSYRIYVVKTDLVNGAPRAGQNLTRRNNENTSNITRGGRLGDSPQAEE